MPNPPFSPIKLYRFYLSGHCHRAELMLSLLGLPHTLIDVNLKAKEQKSVSFLKLNPFGLVPVIDDSGVVVADSNAILIYLAGKYDDGAWLPHDPFGAAQVQRWLSIAAGPLAFGPAAARVHKVFGTPLDYGQAVARAQNLFTTMNEQLANSPYLCGDRATVADVAMYTYTAHAPEGHISLEEYPFLRAWLSRIHALPRFIPMSAADMPA